MMNKALWALAIPAASMLAGCVDTVNVNKGESLVLNATKRVVLVKENPDGLWPARLASSGTTAEQAYLVASRASDVAATPAASPVVEEVGSHVRRLVCAEPSPDALSTLAASVAASVGINGQGGSLGGGVSEAAALAGRTGATQILRDLGYRACEGVMNGVIGAAEYDRIIGGTPPTVLGLVAVEGLTGMRWADKVVIKSDAPATTSNATSEQLKNIAADKAGAMKKLQSDAGVNAPADKSGGVSDEKKEGSPAGASPGSTKLNTGATVGGGKTDLDTASAPKDGAQPPPITRDAADAVVKVVCLATAGASRLDNLIALCLNQPIPSESKTSVVRNDTSPVGQHATRTGREHASR